jgi:para-nitrobenzyl esterase
VIDACSISTTLGTIVGKRSGEVCSWKGIPYARELNPENRFAPPQPVTPWKGEREAFTYSGVAPQRRLLRTKFSPACLTLNIWAPADRSRKRPVLFFIHGGSFTHGAGSDPWYEGTHLSEHTGMVVVTINYRLGILGFSDFSGLESSFGSNLGLQDVLMALSWVHENISAFGGDPDNITAAGQSAGGTMVTALSVCSHARAKISKFMIMSGGPTQLHGVDDCRAISEEFFTFSGLERVDQLRTIPFDELIRLQREFISRTGLGSATFRLTVDGDLIPEYPIPAAGGLQGDRHPMLIGTTREELSFMQFKPLERSINVEKIITHGLQLESEGVRNRLIKGYEQVYGPGHGRMMLYTDMLFRIGNIWFVEAISRHTDLWMYRFDFKTTILKINGLQAFHATDLPYLFGNIDHILIKPMFIVKSDMEDVLEMIRIMQSDVKQFATTGELDWERCSGNHTPAKSYDIPPRTVPAVPEVIKSLYDNTSYRNRSFTPSVNPAPCPVGDKEVI